VIEVKEVQSQVRKRPVFGDSQDLRQIPGKRRTAGNETNALLPEDRPVHEWYRFVLSYPPHLVREYLKRFEVTPSCRVLDPFCGTGTTLVECKKLGIPSVGIEANPMAYFASKVKVNWGVEPTGMLEHARQVAEQACARLAGDGIQDTPLYFTQDNERGPLLSLPPGKMKLLLSDSISPLPMHKALVLLDLLTKLHDEQYHDHERLALARAAVQSASNLRFGPEVGIGSIKTDASVVGPWLDSIKQMSADLREVQGLARVSAAVHLDDSRNLVSILPPASIDAVITSPPYPNEKDYTRTTRLESVLLGFIGSKTDLRDLKRTLVRSNTRGVYREDQDDAWAEAYPQVQELATAIEARRVELGKTSGFERLYARVTKLYFGGMARHLAELRTILKPGADLAYVVGDQASYLRVMIRTSVILSEIARSLGYESVGTDLFRTRFATATQTQMREDVLLLRWPG
jgi:DNA modification methylase